MNRFETQDSRSISILLERKKEFQNFCEAYLTSFGWTITSNSFGEIKAFDSLHQNFTILIIFHPHEKYPTYKDLNQYSENIILMAPEFSALCQIKGSKLKKVHKHTASGINFTYLIRNEK